MSELERQLSEVIGRHAELWGRLRRRSVIVTASRGGEGAFYRPKDAAAEAGRLAASNADPYLLEVLCRELEKKSPSAPCVIDMCQAVELVSAQKIEPGEAISRARIRVQGTDGVRGKVAPDADAEPPLLKLARRHEFTPGLCELLCAGVMLARAGSKPPTVIVAEDGRDAFGERLYTRAAIRAFRRFGCRVLDLGIAPTPLLPAAAAMLGAEVAAVVTASHNPADQNGIKFFVNGRKPLPESGDYPLTAFTFLAALEGLPAEKRGSSVERVSGEEVMREYFYSALEKEDIDALRGARLVIDVAHGAFAPFTEGLLRVLGLRAEVINDDMTGENVNRDSGVACIEGKGRIPAAQAAAEVAIVGMVRALSLETSEPVFGVALDGDGDRGLVLVHDRDADEVRTVDGDRLAYLAARLAHERGGSAGRVFAGTVESDLAVFDAVSRLGIETMLTPVGDKWLSARVELAGRLLVGEESSGHLAWPVEVRAAPGGKTTVVTGNGLLTGLRGAAAALRLGLTPAGAAEPYPPGVMRTFYTYFVDRARFHRESVVWRDDREIAGKRLRELKARGEMPDACVLRPRDFADDPDMLYLEIAEKGKVLGAVFARNSGTENKTASYARGLARYERQLVGIARDMNENHIRSMKDARLAETRAEEAIASALAGKGQLPLEAARAIACAQGITGEAAFFAILFALAREGKARHVGDEVVASDA
jgi:phosphoglucosamine mutase